MGAKSFQDMVDLPVLPVYYDYVGLFLANLSREILKNKEALAFGDVVALAYFCRKANIERWKNSRSIDQNKRIGRGLNLHIAPGNVPTNFAYSLIAGLLAGNPCIVRVSSKYYPQTELIIKAMEQVLYNDSFCQIRPYIAIISYDKFSKTTDYLSELCAVRVIWGGDETIKNIRRAPLSARSYDLTFADRYSLSLLSAQAILAAESLSELGRNFYNDTYLYDQNACSSPTLIYWLGEKEEVAKAKQRFWEAVHDYTSPKYTIEATTAMNKYLMLCTSAVEIKNIHQEPMPDNIILRINTQKLPQDLPKYRAPGGFFWEYQSGSLDDLATIVTPRYQTIGYYGFIAEDIQNWVSKNGLKGIDRIVPIGKAADFTFIWDGYDLVDMLSRMIYTE